MANLRAAIDAKCKDCVYDPRAGTGTWREQVARCAVIRCPLWPVRTASSAGPWRDPPRDPATVDPAWLLRAMGRFEPSADEGAGDGEAGAG